MSNVLYQTLAEFGYLHPLHPAIAHLPVGLTAAAFLFGLIAFFLRQSVFAQTAHHCTILSLISLVPTIALGLADWQQFYGGASLFPLKMKIMLAVSLLLLLIIAVYWGIKSPKGFKTIIVYSLAFIAVIGLGYYGGELVFGKKTVPAKESTVKAPDMVETSPLEKNAAEKQSAKESVSAEENGAEMESERAMKGEVIFNQLCAGCHFTDRIDFKMGPGLKGLFANEKLYKSGWQVTEENVRKQLVAPFGNMPAYNDLPDETLDALIAYIKTL